MQEVAGGEGLDRELLELPRLAEPGADRGRAAGVGAMGREQAEAPLEDSHGARCSRPGERRRLQARVCRPARVQRLRVGAVAEKLEQPRGEAADHSKGVRRGRAVEAQQPRARRRGAEGTGHGRGVEAALIEGVGHRDRHPERHLGARGVCRQDVLTAAPGGLTGGECDGRDNGARVADARLVRVVEVERVAARAVRERGRGCRDERFLTEYGRLGPAALVEGHARGRGSVPGPTAARPQPSMSVTCSRARSRTRAGIAAPSRSRAKLARVSATGTWSPVWLPRTAGAPAPADRDGGSKPNGG